MKKRILSIALVLTLLLSCIPFAGVMVSASTSGLIINQVYGNGGKADAPVDYSFVELYNDSDAAIDLTGFQLGYFSGKDGLTDELRFDLTGSIPANSSYLIRGNATNTTTEFEVLTIGEDYDLSIDLTINHKQYNVVVYDDDDGVVDELTAIDADTTEEVAGEGSPFVGVSKQKGIRRVDFADTDNNSADFVAVKYEKATLADYYDLTEFATAYGPKTVADGAWTETTAPTETFVGYDFVNETGYAAIYPEDGSTWAVDANGLNFDTSVTDGYITVDHEDAETLNSEIKYAYITAYSTAPETTDGFTMTIGDIGLPWDQWQVSGGTTAPKLTDEKATYVIDLEDSGVTSAFDTTANAPDFALNQSNATEGAVVIESVRFSNTKPVVTAGEDPLPPAGDDFVGFDFVNKTGYAAISPETDGPFELTEKGLEIDTSVNGGWLTADLEEGEVTEDYAYAVVTMKTSAPATTKNFALGIGGKSNTLFDWYLATTGKKNTNYIGTEMGVYVFDLEESGVTTIDAAAPVFDFAYNQSSATAGILTIASIEFTNTIPTLTLDNEPWVGFDFINEIGYYGPYGNGAHEITANGLEMDMSVADGYITAEIDPQDVGFYRYAYVTISSSDPEATQNMSMTFGGVGQVWHEWTLADGTNPDALLTEEATEYCIDLQESGATTLVSSGIDFAINKGEATGGTITIPQIRFANSAPAAEEPETPLAPPAPANLVAVANGANAIDLTFVGVEDAVNYGVARSTEEEGTYTVIGYTTETSYQDTGLTAETTYFYKVFVADEQNEKLSDYSAVASATTEAEAPAANPADLYVSAVTPATATNYDADDILFNAIVRNTGETAVDTYYVSFYVNSVLVETVEVTETLEAGGMVPVASTEAWPAFFGSHSVKAIVTEDIDGVNITETDLTNNALRTRFTVIDDVNPGA